MTNPTLERAAIAVWNPKAAGLRDDEIANVWLNQSDEERRLYFGIARAVLMAVREPDEAEKAGAFWLSEFQTPGSDTHLRAVAGNTFTAMIDAILADGGE